MKKYRNFTTNLKNKNYIYLCLQNIYYYKKKKELNRLLQYY